MGLLYALICNLLFDLKNILWKAFHLPLLPRLAGQIWRSLIETQQPLWALPTSFKIPLMVYSHFQQPQKTRNIPPCSKQSRLGTFASTTCWVRRLWHLVIFPPFFKFQVEVWCWISNVARGCLQGPQAKTVAASARGDPQVLLRTMATYSWHLSPAEKGRNVPV